MRTTTVCTLLCAITGAIAFTPPSQPTTRRTFATVAIGSTVESSSSEASASSPPAEAAAAPTDKNKPTWEVKQHLYGLDMIKDEESARTNSVTLDAEGEVAGGAGALPLPEKYITCGKCKSLFAISESDLGDKGKGCRVKCSVCNNSWYQSRDRLFDIPTESHNMIPANKSDLNRIARNLSRDIPPSFMGVNKLYVGNLDWRTTSEELLDFFETNAKREGDSDDGSKVAVCDVSIVMGPDGRSRGFAFVSFYNEVDGKAGLACNGLECNGRELAVREPNN
mmetsp:Transcript_16783/g.35307  ORF Transcript_16783/g.35307 Transcript_16783/m.35307 type:complete len:280 (+) Transcript_16783:177-1016(+)